MTTDPFHIPPYFDWALDRWKVGLIVILFFVLLVTTLIDPRMGSGANGASGAGVEQSASANTSQQAPVVADTGESEGQTAGVTATVTVQPSDALMAPPLPLTLAGFGPNAVVPSEAVLTLSGTGPSGGQIEVRMQYVPAEEDAGVEPGEAGAEQPVGIAVADERGLWELPLDEPLVSGQYVITLHQLDDSGSVSSVASPVVITVLENGEQGPLSLATPAIRFPDVGAGLREGRITFIGSGLPGMRVRLYLNDREVAEGIVNTREEWRLTPEEDIAPGIYVAQAAAMNPQGEIAAESAPVVFVVFDSAEAMAPDVPSPMDVRLRLSGMALRGPQRDTLVLSGIATPHSAVSAWLAEMPLGYANARIDGRWYIWLSQLTAATVLDDLSLRTNLGEIVEQFGDSIRSLYAVRPVFPIVLSPQSGEVLTTRRPVLMGMAQPATEVAVLLNSTIVARVLADTNGQWAYQPPNPLPSGEIALAAFEEASKEYPAAVSDPVLVTVAPNM